MQEAGVMFGLKIKPHLAKGSHAGLSPGRPRSPAGAAPSPLSCKAATCCCPAASAGGCQGHFLFFSPTNFEPSPFITQSWGGGEGEAAWEGILGVREPQGRQKAWRGYAGPTARLWILVSSSPKRCCWCSLGECRGGGCRGGWGKQRGGWGKAGRLMEEAVKLWGT